MILKLNDIHFKTNLSFDDIIQIAEAYIKSQEETYEINKETILYDTNDEPYVTDEPVWYVEIISLEIKERWPDTYLSLAISDKERRVVYVQNDHGIVIEKY